MICQGTSCSILFVQVRLVASVGIVGGRSRGMRGLACSVTNVGAYQGQWSRAAGLGRCLWLGLQVGSWGRARITGLIAPVPSPPIVEDRGGWVEWAGAVGVG
ncbi:MAG: hypothetical protein ABI413_11440 [Ktedonobacteraceae bacterium]